VDAVGDGALGAAAPAAVVPVAVGTAPAAPSLAGSASATGSIRGVVGVVGLPFRGSRKVTSAGATIWLVPSSVQLEADDATAAAERDRLAQLDADAERLEREAGQAMRMSNFTQATLTRDELMGQRARVLDERQDVLAAMHGLHEARAREAAVAHVVTDSEGRFVFPAVRPGSYSLYTRLTGKQQDVEWIEPVVVEPGPTEVELNETTARGILPGA
jgi:hypothetical protein